MSMKILSFISVCVVAALLMASCTKLREEKLPTQTSLSVHGQGFADSTSENFHAKYLQANNYDVTKCQQCHGKSYTGGTSNASCIQCHQVIHGVEFGDSTSQNYHAKFIASNQYDVSACQPCHGVNFDGKGIVTKSCLTCHTSVHDKSFGDSTSANFHTKFIQANNYEVESCKQCHGAKLDGKGVEVKSCLTCHVSVHDKSFGDSASMNFHTKFIQTNNYDVESCQQCHGVQFDGKGVTVKSCYRCHTVVHGKNFGVTTSPNYHAAFLRNNNFNLAQCQTCHGAQYNGKGVAVKSCLSCHNKQNGPENCTTCHGTLNAAPPKDVAGNSSPTVRGVGAHEKHLTSSLGVSVPCQHCHTVPKRFADVGHIDNSPHAEVKFDTTSVLFRSNAVYDAANVSCTNTYCHGNFNGGNQNVTMTWTDTMSTATACGTCHGDVTKATLAEKAFPKSGHIPIGDNACVPCHASVINAGMAIINPAKHINGVVDFQ